MKIKIIKDIIFNEDSCFQLSFKKDRIIESDEPYQGLNDDGSFTICQGQGMYLTLEKEYFHIIQK